MNKRERKEWLLHLWDYHNGILRSEEREELDSRLAEDVSAREDSQRVRVLIEELRQAGRWETHPTFPEEMVDRIIQSEASGKWKWVIAALIVLVLLYFLFFRGPEGPEGVRVTPEQEEGLALLAPGRSDDNGGLHLDYSALEEGVDEDLVEASQLTIRSSTGKTE
ncbi:MAG: hypothetical protein H6751_02640 [Candidatus Omnitrophica bacterium]|nr:hypothetical protein [Candidatus Omnitrophota bacterium]